MPIAAALEPLGPAHLAVLAFTLAAPLGLAWVARRARSEKFSRVVAWSLSLLLLANEAAHRVYQHAEGQLTWQRGLPMQLCDWAMFAVVAALLTRRRAFYEPAYFWGLAGTFQAILTPNLDVTFPHFRFLSYFIVHSGIVIGVLFLTFGMGFRPTWSSLWRTIGWSEVYLVSALVVNRLTGANYGFLSDKPKGPSLLSWLSDWPPLYVAEINLVAIGFFLALYVPFAIRDAMRRPAFV